jgi:hypothetical protein
VQRASALMLHVRVVRRAKSAANVTSVRLGRVFTASTLLARAQYIGPQVSALLHPAAK